MTNQSELEELDRLIIENQSEDGSIDISDQRAMRDEIVAYITANYTPNTKLKALIEASEKLNLEFHGRPDCKNCSLQEQLAELTKGASQLPTPHEESV